MTKITSHLPATLVLGRLPRRLDPGTVELAVAGGAAMFLPVGTGRTVVEIAVLVVQAALVLGRGWYRRRTARPIDPAGVLQQFAALWSAYALGGQLVGPVASGSPSDHVVEGLLFAVPVTIVIWGVERAGRRRTNPTPPTTVAK